MSKLYQDAEERLRILLETKKYLTDQLQVSRLGEISEDYGKFDEEINKMIDMEYASFRGTKFEKEKAKEHLTRILKTYSAELKPLEVVSTEIKVKIDADTSELDEAIVKTKILNDELEKAKSIIDKLAGKEKAIVSGETMAHVVDQIRREMRD